METIMALQDLPGRMRRGVGTGPGDYRLEEGPVPQAGRDEVVIRVDACGICASDVKCYSGAALFWGDLRREGYAQAPITAGHEFVGTVVALGEGAAERYRLAIGDRV